MIEWRSVDREIPNKPSMLCRVLLSGLEQEPFYRYKDGKWQVQKDNGVWKTSHFTSQISHFYVCPEPPKESK